MKKILLAILISIFYLTPLLAQIGKLQIGVQTGFAKPAGLDLQSKSNTTRICNPFFTMPIMKQMY